MRDRPSVRLSGPVRMSGPEQYCGLQFFSSPTHHFPPSSRCLDLPSPFPHGTLHEQPGRVVWVASVGCVRCPPFFLTRCPQSAALQVSSRSYSFRTTPFTSNPGMPPWLPRWGGTRDPSALCPGHREGLHGFFFRRWRFCASF